MAPSLHFTTPIRHQLNSEHLVKKRTLCSKAKMAFRITVELPDECLKIVNFKSDDEEPPFEFECSDDKSTVLDVKKFINDEEALDLEDLTTIKIYWLFGILQDDVLVKDLLDQKAELYVSLPQFAEITATGNTFILLSWIFATPFYLFSGETIVFSKTKNFGR